MDKQEFYTLAQLDEKLKISTRTLQRKLRTGELKGYKKAGKWFVLHSDVVEWIKG